MLDKLKQKIFPSDERNKALREIHAKSLELNTEARERLIVVCEIKKKVDKDEKPLRDFVCIVR